MASFLEDLLRTELAKGFKDKLLVGVLTRIEYGVPDNLGNPTETKTNYRVEGFVDNYSDYYRAQVGIPIGDVKIVLIAGNCQVDPIKDDVVKFVNWPTYKIRQVSVDPGKAHYECQSFEVK